MGRSEALTDPDPIRPIDPMSSPEPEVPAAATAATAAPTPAVPPGDVVARAGRYYRNTRYLMCLMFIGMGLWFGVDGFSRYPAQNVRLAQIESRLTAIDAQLNGGDRRPDAATQESLVREQLELQNEQKSLHGGQPHTETDIALQRFLALALPVAGLILLAWALYNSRDAYRLTGDTLQAPGHPPVPLSAIKDLDERQWDRKGIAYAKYELPDSTRGTIKLDDFVYDRPPIDAIYDRIKAEINARTSGTPA